MSGTTLIAYLLLGATLMRALLGKAHVLPPTCARCGLRLKRPKQDERVCTCKHHQH